jgi:hypothetical protein
MPRRLVFVLAVAAMAAIQAGGVMAAGRTVVINGTRIADRTVAALETAYRTRLADGRYWYDARSGLWGFEGGPTIGQIHAGLMLGGALHPQASNGDTRVFVNGRRLPRSELWQLEQLVGPVYPGRYWLDAHGYAGYEGGPAIVNVFATARRQAGAAGGYGGRNQNTYGGNWGGDGECSYYSHPNGSSVMVGNC